MQRRTRQNQAIRSFILENVAEHPGTIATLAAKKFGVSRTTTFHYMKRLIEEGWLRCEGKTRGRRYYLKAIVDVSAVIPLSAGLAEDAIWRFRILPHVKDIKKNIIDICQYGFTEMLNNAIDHSGSDAVFIKYAQTYNNIRMVVMDEGIGIFEKIQRDFQLSDPRSALLELSKGRLTSDSKKHSGEGIFFTSRMFDEFSIWSRNLCYIRRQIGDGWLVETDEFAGDTPGTTINMSISTKANRTRREIFNQYQTSGNISFRTTHVPIKLGKYSDEELVSRSQAKRILARFDNFSEVLLDFDGVPDIGQAFADEIFRVFKSEHPEIRLIAVNTTPDVARMINAVQQAHLGLGGYARLHRLDKE